MVGKICFLANDVKKEKYIIYGSYYGNEVLDLIGINETNRGKVLQISNSSVTLDEEAQKIIDKI